MFFSFIVSILNAAIPVQGVSKIVDKVSNAVVEIETFENLDKEESWFQDFFGNNLDKDLIHSNGSGIILSENGLVVTLASFIKDEKSVAKIRLKTRAEYDATVKYIDEDNNLAFLQISLPNNKKLPFLKIGNSDNVCHGDFIVSIGSTLGLGQSVAGGIVSMPTRVFNNKVFLQTDTSIYPGNLGGAVIDIQGNLIGMLYSQKTASYGIGFAIPSNLIKVLKDRVNGVSPATFEVNVSSISQKLRKNGIHHGVLVEGTGINSPIKNADIITKINNIPINSLEEFQYREKLTTPGQTLTFHVFRDNKYIDIKIKTQKNTDTMFHHKENGDNNKKVYNHEIVINDNSILKDMKVSEVSSGLLILEPPSKCNVILKKDDIICEINNQKNKKDIIDILESLDNNKSFNISIKRNQNKIHYKIKKLSNHFIFRDTILAEIEKNKQNNDKYLMIVYPDINMKEKWINIPLKGDIIEKIDDNPIHSIDEINDLKNNFVTFTIKRKEEYFYWKPEYNSQYNQSYHRSYP
jgi:serine protease Do